LSDSQIAERISREIGNQASRCTAYENQFAASGTDGGHLKPGNGMTEKDKTRNLILGNLEMAISFECVQISGVFCVRLASIQLLKRRLVSLFDRLVARRTASGRGDGDETSVLGIGTLMSRYR
jgi:hypothetical protein